MTKPHGVITSWRDEGGTLRRWFKTQSEADSFKEQITGAPGICDYLSDILGELEANRAELEGMRNTVDAIQHALEGVGELDELKRIRAALEDIRDALGGA